MQGMPPRIAFFRQTVMCKISVRLDGKGVVFSVVKKEGDAPFREGRRMRAVLGIDEVGEVLLFPKGKQVKNGVLSFYHDYRAARDGREGKSSGGRLVSFLYRKNGEVAFSIKDKERDTNVAFVFSLAEWLVVKLFLQEALRYCFYAKSTSPRLSSEIQGSDGRLDSSGNEFSSDDVIAPETDEDVFDEMEPFTLI